MPQGRQTIAVVDDDAAVRRALDRLLRGAGFEVLTFASAEEYLARQQEVSPFCLVLDISLGGMSGLELREELVRHGLRIPVVFITAHAKAEPIFQTTVGAPCLRKPFDEVLLFEAIATATGVSPAQ